MFRFALKNIFRAKIRSLLTLSGVAGSMALFVSLYAISSDLKGQLDQSIAKSHIDVVVQQKGAATPVTSRVAEQAVTALQQLPDVAGASAVIVGSVKVPNLPYLFLFGLSSAEPYLSLATWLGTGLIDGRMLRPGEKEVMLGRYAALRLNLKVGDQLLVAEKEAYRICGIYWLGQGILDGGVMVDLKSSQALLQRQGFVNLVLLEGKDKQQTLRLLQQIQKKFPDLEAMPGGDLRSRIRAISMIDGFVAAVSATALLLGAVIILNTLLMAVSERTREIGILMAVGWSRPMIIRLLISEAILLGGLGSAIGYGLAFPALKLMTLLPAMGPGWIPSFPAGSLLLVAIALGTIIGGLSALYPALFATRLQPAKALSYE